jgi:cyanophycin synthetase
MTTRRHSPYIISITGTKGKTTIARLLSHIFTQENYSTLLVDTDGHYLNGKQRSTKEDSERLYGLLPATCPGKFLYELLDQPRPMAILETAYLSSSIYGIGYFSHDIGIFTNVFEDHLGKNVKTPAEMAARKARYIFTQLSPDGTAIFNADDKLVCANLHKTPHLWPVTLLPVGLTMKHFNTAAHLAAGGHAFTRRGRFLGSLSARGFTPLLDAAKIFWTFDGRYTPSVYNLLFVLAALFAKNDYQSVPPGQITSIKRYLPSETGGRLTVIKKAGLTVIADYAHEKYSFQEIARLAKHLASKQTIGVLRIQPSRADELIIDTGKSIANAFDKVIIYDKVDGVALKEFKNRAGFTRKVGEASTLLYQAIMATQDANHTAERIIIEEQAIAAAIKMAQPGDVIVHIVNDDHSQSISYIKHNLQAKLEDT